MPQEAIQTVASTTQPVVFSVAGLTFFGISFSDWVLIGTAILLAFNILFACVKAFNLFRRKRDEH